MSEDDKVVEEQHREKNVKFKNKKLTEVDIQALKKIGEWEE